MLISASSLLVLCMYKFVLNLFLINIRIILLYFFIASQGNAKIKESVFLLPVGL